MLNQNLKAGKFRFQPKSNPIGVLISIRPEWLRKILNGEKTIEIRKSAPKRIGKPFKVYLYCSKKNTKDPMDILEVHYDDGRIRKCNGHVVAECVCREVAEYTDIMAVPEEDLDKSRLSEDSFSEYMAGYGGKCIGWHLDNVKIYEEPRDLDSFGFDRAPQSWGYVFSEVTE